MRENEREGRGGRRARKRGEAQRRLRVVAAVLGAVRHKGNRFCVNRDPRACQPLSSFFFLPFLFSFYPLLPRAILSSRICDHQHAKWIKFLDYTFRSPFLYLLPIPILGRLTPPRPLSSLPSRIAPTVFQIVSPHEYLYHAQYPPSVFPLALSLYTLRFCIFL